MCIRMETVDRNTISGVEWVGPRKTIDGAGKNTSLCAVG